MNRPYREYHSTPSSTSLATWVLGGAIALADPMHAYDPHPARRTLNAAT